jgi:hypothetical protein
VFDVIGVALESVGDSNDTQLIVEPSHLRVSVGQLAREMVDALAGFLEL